MLVIDDTALPKKGRYSVGVAAQYASVIGKNANCQTLVSVTLAADEVAVMVGLRLFLPESWTSDPIRTSRARVPVDCQAARSKPEIAIEEIDWIRTAGVRFGCVLADADYGLSAPFRQALSKRELSRAVCQTAWERAPSLAPDRDPFSHRLVPAIHGRDPRAAECPSRG